MAEHDITRYGAVGDGVTLDTAAVQAAIDAAHADGGGTVTVPAGRTFLIGSIELRSQVELHVERGAVLQGSPHWAHYTARFKVGALSAGIVTESSDTSAALLTARDAADISITGGGVIDGAGAAFAARGAGQRDDILVLSNERPFLAFLLGCNNITVRDVTLRQRTVDAAADRMSGCADSWAADPRRRPDAQQRRNRHRPLSPGPDQ